MAYNKQDKGKQVIAQYKKLKAIRDPLDQQYQDCYRYTNPTLGVGFNRGEDSDGVAAAQTTKTDQSELFDTTATSSVRLLSSSVLSSLTPPGTRWFDLGQPTADEDELDQEGKQWLADVAALIHTMIHSSNYDVEALEFVLHVMIAGMSGLYIELKDDKYHFETWPLNHLYCQETLNNGYIDTVYRSFHWTVGEAVLEFGLDKLPQHLKDAYAKDENCTVKHCFYVAIRPRIIKGKQANGKTAKMLPWQSIWVAECGSVVKESGFNEMPVVVPRWMKIPDTDYARGPVFDTLPDIKTLNKVKKNMLLNMDMTITGMFKVKDDGIINPNTIKFGARRVIPVGDMDSIAPLVSGGDVQFAMNEVASLQASIRSMLLADQLGPVEKSIMTATEVQTRNNQVRQILGPIFSRLQSEFLAPLIERCFGLAIRANLLPQVPQSIAHGKGNFKLEYRSPLARSQKMQELEAIDQLTNRINANAQVHPEMLDFVNFDAIVKKTADLLAVDPSVMNDDDAVKKIRYQRAQAQKAQQQSAERVATAQAQAQGAQQPQGPQVPAAANDDSMAMAA